MKKVATLLLLGSASCCIGFSSCSSPTASTPPRPDLNGRFRGTVTLAPGFATSCAEEAIAARHGGPHPLTAVVSGPDSALRIVIDGEAGLPLHCEWNGRLAGGTGSGSLFNGGNSYYLDGSGTCASLCFRDYSCPLSVDGPTLPEGRLETCVGGAMTDLYFGVDRPEGTSRISGSFALAGATRDTSIGAVPPGPATWLKFELPYPYLLRQ